MIAYIVIAVVLLVLVLAFAGAADDISRTITKSDKPHPPKMTLNRTENLRRNAAHKQAVADWKAGVDSGARGSYPEYVGLVERLVRRRGRS